MRKANKSVGLVEVNSISYIEEAFSALQQGNTVVPLASLTDIDRLSCIDVCQVIEPQSTFGWFAPELNMSDGSVIAHVAFTSGTESKPKAAFLSRTALKSTVAQLQQLMQMDASAKEYIGVPVYHSFGYGRCRHLAAVGGRAYIPSNGFDFLEFAHMLASGEINSLAIVPSLLRVVLQQSDIFGKEVNSLKWLEIGSQLMMLEEKQAVKKLFPNAVIVQHYGLTEASRTTLLPIHAVPEKYLDSVGKPYGDTCINITDSGRIAIRGPHVATQLLEGGKRFDICEASGWLETSDLGFLKDDYLYFLGRVDNVVNCGGQKLATQRLELSLLKVLGVDDVFVSRIPDKNYGEAFLVTYINPRLTGVIEKVSTRCLADLGVKAKNAIFLNQVKEVPKTHKGKVKYKVLVENYLSSKDIVDNLTNDEFLKIFSDVLKIPLVTIDDTLSVADIGVDSLQSIQLSMRLEQVIDSLPFNWIELPIHQLSVLPRKVNQLYRYKEPPSKSDPLWDGSSNMNPKGLGFWALVKEDFITHDKNIFSQGFVALFVHRYGNARMGLRIKALRALATLLYRFLNKLIQVICGIKLDYTVHVGRRVKLEHFGGMILGARRIGDNVIIRQNTTMGIRDMSDLSAKPIIEDGVNIGAGAVIVGDIVVGKYSIIGANCVISKDVPAFSLVSAAATITRPLKK